MSVQPDHDRRWKTLGVLGLSLVLIGLDNTVLNVALPSMQRELDASASVLQWMVDAYLLVFAGLLLIAGTLGDRHGRKRALQAGLVVFGLASAAALFASTGGHVIAARAVMGLGAAFIMPATLSIVIDVFPREERGKAIGAWAGMAAIGSGLGPAIGGGLLEVASWQSVFALNLPVVALALVLGRRLVPESRDPAPGRLDLTGGALSVAALAVLVLTIIEAPEAGWTAGPTLAGFGIAAVLGAAFVWQERRTADPLLDVALFRLPSFSVASLAVAGAFFALFGMIFALTQFLQLAQGASPLEAGLKQMPVALGLVLSAPLSHLVVQRVGRRAVVAVGLVALAACLLSVSTWTPATSTTVVCLFAFLVAFAMGFVMGPATESVMNAVPEEHAGVGSATNDVNRMVAGALGVAVSGSVLSTAYASRMEDATAALPAPAAEAAADSIGGAAAVAAALPPQAADALSAAAGAAFTDAMGISLVVAAGVIALTAGAVLRWLPGGDTREVAAPAGAAVAASPRAAGQTA
jgi:EmrB/QacA subfamily drug resistance transporter